ncbi:MAG: Type 1 glutamine amidotransferase-like domain-containing protein [Lachnospiraceae bacterium]|nr:Type 1 glutamine amidotransferase-like domain-containing protein [Lachnospiraceae bacterium]
MDMKEENIRFSKRSYPDEEFDPDIVYVTEGNTFEVLKYMKELGIFKYIKKLARDKSKDLIYIGSSAGAMIAGDDIMLAKDFDSNTVGLYDYTSLGLFEGAVVPHYTEEQLKLYIESTEKHILERYYTIYSVSNDEMLEL